MPCPECDFTDRIIVRHKEATIGYELAFCECSVDGKKDVAKKAVDKANSKKRK